MKLFLISILNINLSFRDKINIFRCQFTYQLSIHINFLFPLFNYNLIRGTIKPMSQEIFADKYDGFEGVPSPVTYSDDVNSNDYVAQFLNIFYLQNEENEHSGHTFDHHQKFLPQHMEQSQFEGEEGDGESEIAEKKSCFHNFQKHLVTTLKNCINGEEIKENLETKNLERRLWNFFVASNKNTRTLLYLVCGGIDLESKKSKRLQRKYGIGKIIKNDEYSSIIEAQKNLREQMLKQSANINLDEELKNRRMRDKENFRMYYTAFIEELKSGKLNKRVPKQKKMSVQNRNVQKNTKDFQGLSFNKA